MPVDYSKWDALELSDDSDIEVHPNVDKRSFIRAKQNQIHAERQQRKLQIETLKYERQINDGLIKRISALLAALKKHASEAESRNPAEVAFQAVMESAGNPADDKPPARPEGVHANAEQPPSYTKMMASLLDQVNKAMDEKKPENRYTAMVAEIEDHLSKVEDLQKQLLEKLAELEKEEGRKITSEGLRDGFNTSHVAKSTPAAAGSDKKTSNTSTSSSQPELLNPNFSAQAAQPPKDAASAGDEDDMDASADGRKFASIKASEYRESHAFITSHPHILAEKETDGILVMAFDAQLEGKDDVARNCVHQALLLQYCRSLGRDGVSLFFKRVTTKGHQAQDVFYKDVQDTYFRIKNRTKEINAERAAEGSGDVEQIQLHAVEPGTEIKIRIPPADSQDEEEKRGREIFDSFAPDMKKALESGSLDKVNQVLGKMKVADAEELVGLLSEAGVLSLEEEVIDATTEEGKRRIKEMEDEAALESYAADPE
ncbi:Cdc37 N terminal kinase binding-domain-containing protein [Microdochium trichocladiopsis]|uniref:Hsp90 chaperone protein kinase-targeting subunit n=1 Tax=Microdochium trichocladiopsis TaxID=1682393 RepID=A0A9P9BSI4_9PEZI|nr:Cdc37 N terminal kinase binding-domain-containing protein [Microdochium trichocladiopsis]KAH7037930.1 Cdc37 N terminal kinase binding-domain-containing protein [Microdochium trichocladiopsis]